MVFKEKLKKIWGSLGPGLITGASDDDPSGIVTYSVAGAKMGPHALWSMLYTLPLMIAVQEMSARIGMSSQCGLAGNIKKYYSKTTLILISSLIIIANTFNIGADVFGMASAIELLIPGSTQLLSWIVVGGILSLIVLLPYRKIVSVFKWLSMALLAYVIAGFTVIDNWPTILWQMVAPSFSINKENFIIVVALFGTTISPYLAFWQASEEAEEKRIKSGAEDKPYVCEYKIVTKGELIRATRDTRIGMFFSNAIAFFIIALASSVLFNAGVHDIETIKDAADALKPLAGNYAYILFAFGVIGAGLLAIPVLAGSSAYVLSEIFGWKGSLNKPFSRAKEFYMVIIVSALVGLIIPNLGISPVQALFFTALIHGAIAPFLIAMILHMANNPAIVGPNVNGKTSNILGYITLFAMAGAIITLIVTEFTAERMQALIGLFL